MTNINVDKNIRQYGKDNKVPITLDDTLSFLCETIDKYDCKEILEIGTAIGYGSITMAENTNLRHIDTVEIDEKRYKIANKNIIDRVLEGKISTHLMDAMDYLKNNKKQYDLVYLDGAKGQYINYLPYILNVLKTGGIIIADNLNFHGMVTGKIPISKGCRAMIKGLKKYITAVTTNSSLTTKILEIGDGVGFTIKN